MRMMKFGDFIRWMNHERSDLDVYVGTNCVCAYCGDDEMSMSAYCMEKYADIMDLDIEVREENGFATVILDGRAFDERQDLGRMVSSFLHAAAGYVSCAEYDKLFTFGGKED